MAKELSQILSALGVLYFFFDFFLWNGGLLNPSIIARISAVGAAL